MIGTYEYPLGPSYIEYKKEKSENGECSVSICGLGPGFKNLVIPSEINGFPVYKIDTGAFLDYDRLQSVTFPDTLKIIGQSAFEDCDGLKSISFPPSLYEIGTKAFSDCQNLASVVFNEGLHAIKYDAFYSCKIKSLKFPDSLVTIYNNAFSDNPIKNIVFGSGLKEILDGVFSDCTELTSIRLPDSLISLGISVFDACSSLKSIHIGANLSKYESRYDFAYCCSDLKEITVSPKNKKFKVIDGVLYDTKRNILVRVPPRIEKDSITIPAWVKYAANYSFEDVKFLNQIKVRSPFIDNLSDAMCGCSRHLLFCCEPNSRVETWARTNAYKVQPLMSQMEEFFSSSEISLPKNNSSDDISR